MADEDVITTTVSAPRTRNAEELSARIKAANGALVVSANDSDYIVASNNRLWFSITPQSDGRILIQESQVLYWLIGAGILAVVLLLRR